MENNKIRINISELSPGSRGSSGFRPVDFDNYEEFVEFLKKNQAHNISLVYNSIIEDSPEYHQTGLSVNGFTRDDFDWLSVKRSGQHRFVEYIKMEK